MKNKSVTLDLTGCKSITELHERIKKSLDFPSYYGGNWSAFWDCLNRENDFDTIFIIGGTKMAKELQPAFEKLQELLERNKDYWEGSARPFSYVIRED